MSDSKEIIAVKALNNYSIEEILRTQNNILPSSDIYENTDEFILGCKYARCCKKRSSGEGD